MKNNFIDTEDGRLKLEQIFDSFKAWLLKDEDLDLEVIRQKTVFYKAWCWFLFRHTENPTDDSRCKRCGKKAKKYSIKPYTV
jgi:hypothetical protein